MTTGKVEKLIGSSSCKFCQLDPVPTWLVKNMKALLSPFSCCFPSDFKRAVLRPLLKKGELDTSQMKNYRPVSNLSFLSKSLDRVVQRRLHEFLDSNNLIPETLRCVRCVNFVH